MCIPGCSLPQSAHSSLHLFAGQLRTAPEAAYWRQGLEQQAVCNQQHVAYALLAVLQHLQKMCRTQRCICHTSQKQLYLPHLAEAVGRFCHSSFGSCCCLSTSCCSWSCCCLSTTLICGSAFREGGSSWSGWGQHSRTASSSWVWVLPRHGTPPQQHSTTLTNASSHKLSLFSCHQARLYTPSCPPTPKPHVLMLLHP